MNVRKLSLFVVLMLLLALAVAACGGGGTETAATVEPAAEEAATEVPAAEEPAATDLGTAENPIVMSFVPSGDTQDIIASGDTLAAMITEATGLVVESNVGTDFSAVREAMCAGQAHIGWLNTFNYVMANEQCGVDAGMVTSRFDATTYSCLLYTSRCV